MDRKVAVFGVSLFPLEKIESVLPYLKRFVEATQQLDGCELYEVALDPLDKGLIRSSELWPNRDLLNQHLTAPHVAPWREAAKQYGLKQRTFYSYDVQSTPIEV